MDIVEFLSERIGDDEAAARRLLTDPSVSESGKWYEWRLLRECEAKRRLLGIIESARQGALAAMLTGPPGGHRMDSGSHRMDDAFAERPCPPVLGPPRL